MELEKDLGYIFQNRNILTEALTHKSYFHENPNHGSFYNERLEFLGDTVLGLVISEVLFKTSPPFSEAEMARIKSYLVSGRVLSMIATILDLGQYLYLGRGEVETGGRSKESILADSIEALLGAIFIDGGFHEARDAIVRLYEDIIAETLRKKTYVDLKTKLQEISQARFNALPSYRVIREEGLEHEKIFTVEVSINNKVLGVCSGTSKKDAETGAARIALQKINDVSGQKD